LAHPSIYSHCLANTLVRERMADTLPDTLPDSLAMADTLPEASAGSQPRSPDVLEEMEDDALRMLEEVEGATAEPDGVTNGAKDVSEGLDREIADALEEELFAGLGEDSGEGLGDSLEQELLDALGEDSAPPGAAGAADSPDGDFSETELFGPEVVPEAPQQKRPSCPLATLRKLRLPRSQTRQMPQVRGPLLILS